MAKEHRKKKLSSVKVKKLVKKRTKKKPKVEIKKKKILKKKILLKKKKKTLRVQKKKVGVPAMAKKTLKKKKATPKKKRLLKGKQKKKVKRTFVKKEKKNLKKIFKPVKEEKTVTLSTNSSAGGIRDKGSPIKNIKKEKQHQHQKTNKKNRSKQNSSSSSSAGNNGRTLMGADGDKDFVDRVLIQHHYRQKKYHQRELENFDNKYIVEPGSESPSSPAPAENKNYKQKQQNRDIDHHHQYYPKKVQQQTRGYKKMKDPEYRQSKSPEVLHQQRRENIHAYSRSHSIEPRKLHHHRQRSRSTSSRRPDRDQSRDYSPKKVIIKDRERDRDHDEERDRSRRKKRERSLSSSRSSSASSNTSSENGQQMDINMIATVLKQYGIEQSKQSSGLYDQILQPDQAMNLSQQAQQLEQQVHQHQSAVAPLMHDNPQQQEIYRQWHALQQQQMALYALALKQKLATDYIKSMGGSGNSSSKKKKRNRRRRKRDKSRHSSSSPEDRLQRRSSSVRSERDYNPIEYEDRSHEFGRDPRLQNDQRRERFPSPKSQRREEISSQREYRNERHDLPNGDYPSISAKGPQYFTTTITQQTNGKPPRPKFSDVELPSQEQLRQQNLENERRAEAAAARVAANDQRQGWMHPPRRMFPPQFQTTEFGRDINNKNKQNTFPKKEPLFPKQRSKFPNPPALLTQPPRNLRSRPLSSPSPNANPKFNMPVRRPPMPHPHNPSFFPPQHHPPHAMPIMPRGPSHQPMHPMHNFAVNPPPPQNPTNLPDSKTIPLQTIQKMTASMKPKYVKTNNNNRKNNSRPTMNTSRQQNNIKAKISMKLCNNNEKKKKENFVNKRKNNQEKSENQTTNLTVHFINPSRNSSTEGASLLDEEEEYVDPADVEENEAERAEKKRNEQNELLKTRLSELQNSSSVSVPGKTLNEIIKDSKQNNKGNNKKKTEQPKNIITRHNRSNVPLSIKKKSKNISSKINKRITIDLTTTRGAPIVVRTKTNTLSFIPTNSQRINKVIPIPENSSSSRLITNTLSFIPANISSNNRSLKRNITTSGGSSGVNKQNVFTHHNNHIYTKKFLDHKYNEPPPSSTKLETYPPPPSWPSKSKHQNQKIDIFPPLNSRNMETFPLSPRCSIHKQGVDTYPLLPPPPNKNLYSSSQKERKNEITIQTTESSYVKQEEYDDSSTDQSGDEVVFHSWCDLAKETKSKKKKSDVGISADFVRQNESSSSSRDFIEDAPLDIFERDIPSNGIVDIPNILHIQVEDLQVRHWQMLGYTEFQANELINEFERAKRAMEMGQTNRVFYEKNSHVYIDSDFADVLRRIYGHPDLDTHSCSLANKGKHGVKAKRFYGPDDLTDGYSEPWGDVPLDPIQINVVNPISFRCYSNPPYGHAGACKKFCGKTSFEFERHKEIFRETNECYEHSVIISTAIHGHDENSLRDWFRVVQSKCLLSYRVFELQFRVPDGRGGFEAKFVSPERSVVFLYMASGPEEWICKRVGEVRAIFEAHFKGRFEDLSLRI